MRAKIGILPHIIWIIYIFVPQVICLMLICVLSIESKVFIIACLTASMIITIKLSRLVKFTRRRVYQAKLREMALQENKSYIIISRSFAQSKEANLSSIEDVPNLSKSIKISLFESIIDDLSHLFPIIVLGTKDLEIDNFANLAIYINEIPHFISWENVFEELAIKSKAVFIIPGITNGFLNELEIVSSNSLFHKSYVFMWPDIGNHENPLICSSKEKWNSLSENLEKNGYVIPQYLSCGAIMKIEDKQFRIVKKLNRNSKISEIIGELSEIDGTPLKEVIPTIKNVELQSKHNKAIWMWKHIDTQQKAIVRRKINKK